MFQAKMNTFYFVRLKDFGSGYSILVRSFCQVTFVMNLLFCVSGNLVVEYC